MATDDVGSDQSNGPSKARLAIAAFSFGIVLIALGLCLALSALPAPIRSSIPLVGNYFPASSNTENSSDSTGRDALFFIGFGLMSVGMGVVLAHGFAERHTFTFFGLSIGGTLAISFAFFAGWKAITQPPEFRYAMIRFVCSGPNGLAGEVRLRVSPELNNEQRRSFEVALLALEKMRFNSLAERISDGSAPIGDDKNESRIRRAGYEYLLPALNGGVLPLPTLFDAEHTVTAEWKPAKVERASAAAEDASQAPLSPGVSLSNSTGEFASFMKLIVVPKAVEGATEFSLKWRPEFLKVDIQLDKIRGICGSVETTGASTAPSATEE